MLEAIEAMPEQVEIEATADDVEGDERDVVGVGNLGEGEVVERGDVRKEEDRAVRGGREGPGGVGVQRTDESGEGDPGVRGGGPYGPGGRTVRSPRRNQEPPGTNQELCVRVRASRGERGASDPEGEDALDVEDELRALARWRRDGGDPDGLGPWPEAVAPDGTVLPRLALRRKDLRARLGEGRSAVEIHRAVHGFAELVRAGVLGVENWRAPYCFAGFFDGLVVEVRRLETKREAERRRELDRQAEAQEHRISEQQAENLDLTTERMAVAYAESETLQSMVAVVRAEATPSHSTRRPSLDQAENELLNVRIRVHAVADMLDREVDEVLHALGRASMREVVRADADQLDRVFVALRDGACQHHAKVCTYGLED
ncbi:hypothetical protein [Paraliomyxa miuraensis]|uniref:hypothetical protein n=1 Tax=Paraliomyxa miuraensis TaxID=376150 RepID=UPI0022522723|nr:hypothetical protein [Paraliomyxa miuraensis]MCX4244227.1 hypothetical protein [Paraliomyxa miuraensis]